jgi:hypothetical protein
LESVVVVIVTFPEFVLVTFLREWESILSPPIWVTVTEGFGVSSFRMGGTGTTGATGTFSWSTAAGAGTATLAASELFFSLSR